MSETILFTGGTGFLGSQLIKSLVDLNYKIILLKRTTSNLVRVQEVISRIEVFDLDRAKVDELFDSQKIDFIIHCATNYGRQSQGNSLDLVQTNLIFPLELLHCAVKHKVKAFINTDTTLSEEVSEYSLSKKHFLAWLKRYSASLFCINIAIEHFYGPFDDSNKFLSSLIHKLLTGEAKLDFTLGEQKRDFVYIEDVVKAFLCILSSLNNKTDGFIEFEVGSGRVMSIRALVEKVAEMIGNQATQLNFGALPYRAAEVMESSIDLTAIYKLGWRPQVALTEGLSKTIQYEKESLGL